MSNPVVSLDRVTQRFGTRKEQVTAVDRFSLDLEHGELVCLVGESGCGKSTVGKIMAGLIRPSEGQVRFGGVEHSTMGRRQRQGIRKTVQYVHQDPYSSLIPSITVGAALEASLPKSLARSERVRRGSELLESVSLDASEVYRRLPGELSGGQRQRVSIARALTVDPKVLVADEAVSMIDASIRVSILDTLKSVAAQRQMAVLLITHDLGVASYFASGGRIGVMYLGRMVELGSSDEVIARPGHPYSKALVAASQAAVSTTNRYLGASLYAEIPDPRNAPSGCSFHPRCADRIAGVCSTSIPKPVALGRSMVSCHAVGNSAHTEIDRKQGEDNVPTS